MNTRSVKSSHVSAFGIGTGVADGRICCSIQPDSPWTDRSHLQPRGRHPGTAVQHKCDRPRGDVGTLFLVGDEGDIRQWRILAVSQPDAARGGGEFQLLSRQRQRLMGRDVRRQMHGLRITRGIRPLRPNRRSENDGQADAAEQEISHCENNLIIEPVRSTLASGMKKQKRAVS